MEPAGSQSALKGHFDKLSLKKNRKKVASEVQTERKVSTIVLDESYENLKMAITCQRGDWRHISSSPIVINDSFEVLKDHNHPQREEKLTQDLRVSVDKSPKRRKMNLDMSITPKTNQSTIDLTENLRPSPGGWSPAQNIILGSPKCVATPSRVRDIANESQEECSFEQIRESHKNILDELYGDVWKSIPTLFKKKAEKRDDNLEGIAKKLDFADADESNKENSDIFDTKALNFYDSKGEDCSTPKPNSNADIRSKKKLYTEKPFETPNTDIKKLLKKEIRELQTFTERKTKPKSTKETERKGAEPKKVRRALEKPEAPLEVKKLSFMASLADNVPTWRCEPEALVFKNNYKRNRDQLTRRLYQLFNEKVFNGLLEQDMPIAWDGKLRSTAGTTTNRLVKTSNLVKLRTSSIKLSSKVIDGPQRLRDTLVHEMCHSATWIVDHELNAGHGPLWKKWAKRALSVFPELEEISRCHDMQIHFKYTYKCTRCGYAVNRHSKSIDVTKKCCGYCRGTFELTLNRKTKEGVVVSTPQRAAGDFALFVKEQYASAQDGARTHAQVMKMLGERYAATKRVVSC